MKPDVSLTISVGDPLGGPDDTQNFLADPFRVSFGPRRHSQTTLTRFWLFFDHLPPFIDIFFGINVDKKWTFLDQLIPTPSCKRSL